MSDYNRNSSNSSFDPSWWLIVVAFAIFWPVGVGLLIYKLAQTNQGKSVQRNLQSALDGHQHAYHPPQQRQAMQATGRSSSTTRPGAAGQKQAGEQKKDNQTAPPSIPKKIKDGKAMTIWGAVLTILFGSVTVDTLLSFLPGSPWMALQESFLFFILTGVGVGLFTLGRNRRRQARRMRQILNMVGAQKSVDIRALAEAIPTDYDRACEDIQKLIDDGHFGEKAYINRSTGQLILDGKGIRAEAKPKPKKAANADEQVLEEIRRVNEAIPDAEMTRKIARIEECTQHILEYQKNHPEKASELHTFLDYYLPTTLKILNTYAELERQGIDGENVTATKERIESMMDNVVEGFETQLDKLFQGDMMDISSDIAVMEKMLSRDGLSGGMKIPTAPEVPAEPKAEPATQTQPAQDPFSQANEIFQTQPEGYTPTLTLNPDGGTAAAVQTAPEEEAKP